MTTDTNLNSRILGEPAFRDRRRRPRKWPAAIIRALARSRRPGMPEIAVLLIAATAAEIATESAANLILMATPAMAGQLAIEATAPAVMLPVVDVALPDPGVAGMSLMLANRDLSGSTHSDVPPLPDGSVCAPPPRPKN
ncbi:MAG: hypothetical protein RIB70_07705 [Roseitalea porphyridii]|uniref:hypothetical protein n=1 Tax=Roseitalea porphyridii TaxID=1852022 RepID=UPI0032F05EF6